MSRIFNLTESSIGAARGVYRADSPAQAAKKAGHQQFVKLGKLHGGKTSPTKSGRKSSPKKSPNTLKFALTEKGVGTVKPYHYTARRTLLPKPVEFTIAGVTYKSLYKYETKPIKSRK
jgi:hypothetical protein